MCVGGADVCSPGCWPGSEPSWRAPRLPYPAADGSEPLSVQNLSYNSPRGAGRSAAVISKLLFAQNHPESNYNTTIPSAGDTDAGPCCPLADTDLTSMLESGS